MNIASRVKLDVCRRWSRTLSTGIDSNSEIFQLSRSLGFLSVLLNPTKWVFFVTEATKNKTKKQKVRYRRSFRFKSQTTGDIVCTSWTWLSLFNGKFFRLCDTLNGGATELDLPHEIRSAKKSVCLSHWNLKWKKSRKVKIDFNGRRVRASYSQIVSGFQFHAENPREIVGDFQHQTAILYQPMKCWNVIASTECFRI